MAVDPMAEKYYPTSLYEYCLNNPVKFIDIGGKDPGDVFKTTNQAAIDWGIYYNGASILRKREFGSTIYEVRNNGKRIGYAYSEASIGKEDAVERSEAPNGKPRSAIIHSHGNYRKDYLGNDFSNKDKWNSYNLEVDTYVATPNDSLKKYDPHTTKTTIITTTLPSDPRDPGRKNKIEPKDMPMEKKRSQTRLEQEKRSKLKRTEIQKPEFKTTF